MKYLLIVITLFVVIGCNSPVVEPGDIVEISTNK